MTALHNSNPAIYWGHAFTASAASHSARIDFSQPGDRVVHA
jgi:hypothetical protein